MTGLNINVPGPKAPGYMRRNIALTRLQSELVEIQNQVNASGSTPSPETMGKLSDAMERTVDLLAQFVTTDDGTAAREAILDMSQEQFQDVFAALQGGGSPLASAPASGTPSAVGPEAATN